MLDCTDQQRCKYGTKKGAFSRLLLEWFRENCRNFPWRETISPYEIAVAEALLQKTAANNVVPVYRELITRFPRVKDLAEADLKTVLDLLKPLGLPARAERLYQLAQVITSEYKGSFPKAEEELQNLPGIGPYGAAAIMSQAFNQRVPMIDINTKRIFHRVFSMPFKPRNAPTKALRNLVLRFMPDGHTQAYNLALLDLGALLCHAQNPECDMCPLAGLCDHHRKQ